MAILRITSRDIKKNPGAGCGWHGGDLRGVDAHLDYLKELGADHAVADPDPFEWERAGFVSRVCGRGSVCGGFALRSPERLPEPGTRSACAEYEIVFDIVPNHIGLESPWVHDPPSPDWLHGERGTTRQTRYNIENSLTRT